MRLTELRRETENAETVLRGPGLCSHERSRARLAVVRGERMSEITGKPGEITDHRVETVSRPPPARRDPRADPDDSEGSSARVDVVNVERPERGSGDPLTNAAFMLRRELAKLHQQAAAVERTI